jgi:glutathione synthase/RimK-type ligase-like ATP-grasp enzyme
MKILFVLGQPDDWPANIDGAQTVASDDYLHDPAFADCADTMVVNFSGSWRYQSRGYYVSMVAQARGHSSLPDIETILDVYLAPGERKTESEIESGFVPAAADRMARDITLNMYFGRCALRQEAHRFSSAPEYLPLARKLFERLRTPLLQIRFEHDGGRWRALPPLPLHPSRLSFAQRQLAQTAAAEWVSELRRAASNRHAFARKPRLAILRTPDCTTQPSNAAAIEKFQQAASALGMDAELIGKRDLARVEDFDALFIRDTTHVQHYTYQFSLHAQRAGLVVMDDPTSIRCCNNKIYLGELLRHHGLPTPASVLLHRENIEQALAVLGLPCILKLPDGAFSLGVEKVETPEALHRRANEMLERSALILAQQYVPTEFDWRIGILDHRPLFACRYFMAPGHWQIIKHSGQHQVREGMAEAVAIEQAPPQVIDVALRAARLIGDGFYGVDIKQCDAVCHVIEINDNPNVDAGNEDGVLKEALYRAVMEVFQRRIARRRESRP